MRSNTAQQAQCPACGTTGNKVKRRTLESLLTPEAAGRIGDRQYRFCDSLDCETVYFAEDGTVFSKAQLNVRVGVKERTAPRLVCYCFDHTIEAIEAEVEATGQSTVLADIKTRMKTGCWCETKSPHGACCLGTVGKYVKRAIAEHGCDAEQPVPDSALHAGCAPAACASSEADSEENVMDDCCAPAESGSVAAPKGQRSGMLAVGGSIVSALAASACCWIPILLIAFGVSAGGVSAWFEQYRWLFLGLTALLLGTGFFLVYFRKPHCAPGSACGTPSLKLRRFNRVMLWVATIVVIATAAFPKYVGYLIAESPPAQSTVPAAERRIVSLGIDGMTCEGCAVNVRNALVNVTGVLDASVSYSDGTAAISVDASAPPSETDLASAVARAGFKADISETSR